MKKIFLLAGLCVSMLSGITQQLLHEPFNYTPDAVNGLFAQSAGVWTRINSGDSILVEAGNLTYPGLPASTGNRVKYDSSGSDYYTTFTSQTSGTVYSSFILNISSLGSLGTAGGYFTGFIQDASISVFGATVWARASTTAGKYNIGIATRTTAAAVSWLPADLDPGVSYFIVRAYEMIAGTGNDVGKIWLNPAIGGAEPAADATAAAGTDLSSVARLFLRQDNATNTPFVEIDEIRVGTTWASVTPGGAPVPTLSISSPLSAFGNVCINTTAGPNSFTITGTDLTADDLTIGALTGFSYSTSAMGTYTPTLTITQAGGNFTGQVYVQFDPVAVQSYDGNINVSGGGAASAVNVPASGSGVNTAPTVVTGAPGMITMNSAEASGTISNEGCSAITAYGIEYSTTLGFPNGTGTQVAGSNLAGGNFSATLTGLTQGTVYYYKAYAGNAGGTTYGAEEAFQTATPDPTINVTGLQDFGGVCINTVAGPHSFQIQGVNLTTDDVVVGALNGFTYSTTAGGTYTPTLTLVQPGGTFVQDVYVKFEPLAVQFYSGNIMISGGGLASPVPVGADGEGVNSVPALTTGSAGSITATVAILAGTVDYDGCTAVTAYGIEYSTVMGFPDGSGTQVPSSNIAGGAFSSALSGLSPSTTYYYKAYAANAGGTGYGLEQSFTTAAPPPPQISVSALDPFGSICINTTAGPNTFTITGSSLDGSNITVGPRAGYGFSDAAGGPFGSTLTIPGVTGSLNATVYVQFAPVQVQNYAGNIPVSGGGASAVNVAASGSGVNSVPVVVTGSASSITTTSAVLAGAVSDEGCSAISSYGIEYSGIDGFTNGDGTRLLANNISGNNFSVQASGLVQGATYYYKAFAGNDGGTAYGPQDSFTVASIPAGFTMFPVPVERGATLYFSMDNLKPGYYGLLFFSGDGRLVLQKNINIQGNFINQSMQVPGSLPRGVYRVQLYNATELVATRSIVLL